MKRILNHTVPTLIIFLLFVSCNRDVAKKGKKAREHFKNAEYNKVIEILETIKPSRRTASLDLLLGKSYSVLFEFEKTDHIFRNTYRKYPSFKDSLLVTYMEIADRFERRKRVDLAVKVYSSLQEIESEYNIDKGFYALGHFYYTRNDLIQAKEFFERGINNISDSRVLTKTKIELMDIYESLGMLKAAIEISDNESSTEIIYRKGKISYELAKEFFSASEFDSALVYCEFVLEINTPKTLIDDTYYLQGEIYSARGSYNDALKCYKEVVKIDRFGKSEIASMARRKIEVLTQLKEEDL
jgi:tetratricopeptide (TPR) repeat protein